MIKGAAWPLFSCAPHPISGFPHRGNTLVINRCHTTLVFGPGGQKASALWGSAIIGRGAEQADEVSGMLKWVRALLRAEEGNDATNTARRRDRVTRQELAAIFADDLAQKVLHKRTETQRVSPQRFMAGRQNQIFR